MRRNRATTVKQELRDRFRWTHGIASVGKKRIIKNEASINNAFINRRSRTLCHMRDGRQVAYDCTGRPHKERLEGRTLELRRGATVERIRGIGQCRMCDPRGSDWII